MKTFFKGLIAAIIGFIASYVAEAETVNYLYIVVYTAGFTLVYLAKNYVFPSISVFGTIDLRDIISGLILAVGSGVVAYAAQYLTTGVITWSEIGNAVWISVTAYLATKFGFDSKKVK